MPRVFIGKEGTSANLRAVIGFEASVVKIPAMAEKLVQVFVVVNKKMEKKIELDKVAT